MPLWILHWIVHIGYIYAVPPAAVTVPHGLSLLAEGFNHNTGDAGGSILEYCPIARRFNPAKLELLFLLFCFFANGGIQGLALVGYWQMPAFAN